VALSANNPRRYQKNAQFFADFKTVVKKLQKNSRTKSY
jgi:hypothetical protein